MAISTQIQWDPQPFIAWVVLHPVLSVVFLVFLGAVTPILWVLSSQLGGSVYRFIQLNILETDEFQYVPRPTHTNGLWTLISGDFSSDPGEPMFVRHRGWMEETGSTVVCPRGLMYRPTLHIVDPVAYHHILTSNCYQYRKPSWAKDIIIRAVGPGIAAVDGQTHKHHRRIISPAFSIMAVKDFSPLFFSHARRLAEKFGNMVDGTQGPAENPFWPGQTHWGAQRSVYRKPVLDVAYWLGRTTLDVIAHAGFGEDFRTIDHRDGEKGHELAIHFKRMLFATSKNSFWQFFVALVASKIGMGRVVERILGKDAEVIESRKKMQSLCADIVHRKKKEIMEEKEISIHADTWKKSEWDVTTATGKRFDLLHLLIRSNMSTDLKDSERLTDEEILGQMGTLLFAGHETTSSNISHVLYQLGRRPELQAQVRAEINGKLAGRDELSYEELNDLPLLDAVIKEALRVMAPLAATVRVATQDDVVPLSKEYPTQNGKSTFNKIFIKEGTSLPILIHQLNTCKDLWGPDALEYRPQRWFDIPTAVRRAEMPLHLMSFIAGPRGCLGQRFSLIEAKAILTVLLVQFQFESFADWIAEPHAALVTQSFIRGQEEFGAQQPLLVSRL